MDSIDAHEVSASVVVTDLVTGETSRLEVPRAQGFVFDVVPQTETVGEGLWRYSYVTGPPTLLIQCEPITDPETGIAWTLSTTDVDALDAPPSGEVAR